MGGFTAEYPPSRSEEWVILEHALEALAWSEHAYCVIDERGNCVAAATDCECESGLVEVIELPEMIDQIDVIEWHEAQREALFKQIVAFVNDDAVLADLEATGQSLGQCGHDFILTRNHHGAGFWDRGYGEAGRRLTAAAQAFGEVHATVLEVAAEDDPTVLRALVGIES
jgi:hypothetical protein